MAAPFPGVARGGGLGVVSLEPPFLIFYSTFDNDVYQRTEQREWDVVQEIKAQELAALQEKVNGGSPREMAPPDSPPALAVERSAAPMPPSPPTAVVAPPTIDLESLIKPQGSALVTDL